MNGTLQIPYKARLERIEEIVKVDIYLLLSTMKFESIKARILKEKTIYIMRISNALIASTVIVCTLSSCTPDTSIRTCVAKHPKTFCNPLNLDYRFMVIDGGNGIREAADPVVIPFKDKYFLFASKSSGYWHTSDFRNWTHVIIPDSILPIEDYAPGIFVHKDYVYYVGSTHGKGMLYRSNDLEKGTWEKVKEIWSYWDPAFYVENDNLYLYYGCSPSDPIYAQVLDLNTLEARSEAIECLNSNKNFHGWERTGEQNELERRPYIEGAWMTCHNGRYYLQYAAPGTEWKTYADGVYVADSPLGPFTYMEESPVSYKPGGFVGGAGHGCMFQVGKHQWKAATNAISVRHMFERRLSFFPAGFDANGTLYTNTYLGDYPLYLPSSDMENGNITPGWMLLSAHKPITVSSALINYPAENAVDEEIRTSWVAKGNGDTEWVQIDLEEEMSVNAIQVNYDEYGVIQKGVNPTGYQSYLLSASHDGKKWYTVADFRKKRTDTPHDYVEFENPFRTRYIRWENCEYSLSANVSLREFRVFGHADGPAPCEVKGVKVTRDIKDRCHALISWQPSKDATGYIIRYGLTPNKLYHSIQVTNPSGQLEITGLNSQSAYYFAVDAYNASGVTRGKTAEHIGGS